MFCVKRHSRICHLQSPVLMRWDWYIFNRYNHGVCSRFDWKNVIEGSDTQVVRDLALLDSLRVYIGTKSEDESRWVLLNLVIMILVDVEAYFRSCLFLNK